MTFPNARNCAACGSESQSETPDPSWEVPAALTDIPHRSFSEAIAAIEALVRLGIDPSLEPMRALLAELNHPERAYKVVQIAGTNGKTSTSRYTAALLGVEGLRTGLYTSPHLVSYTERVEICGRPVREDLFVQGIDMALAAWDRVMAANEQFARQGLTEFELLTAAALVMFACEHVDVAVLEVGLGGRWDATSATDPVACALTGVGLDHVALLGSTLEQIATEKAAIARPHSPFILGPGALEPSSVRQIVQDTCHQAGARLSVVSCDPAKTSCGFSDAPTTLCSAHIGDRGALELQIDVHVAGCGQCDVAGMSAVSLKVPAYQAANVSCALALSSAVLGYVPCTEHVQHGLATCPVPGRFDVLRQDPLLLLDACHNPQSAEAFARAFELAFPVAQERPALLLGALRDKDHAGIIERVVPLFSTVYVTQSSSPRALPAEDLACEITALTGMVPAGVFATSGEALQALQMKPLVVCGTITLIGEITGLFETGGDSEHGLTDNDKIDQSVCLSR